MRGNLKFVLAGASLVALSQGALAQEARDAGATDGKEIVVTGTLIRGVAPAGTNVLGVTKGAVEETGAATTSQLLEKIPQFGSFNSLQAPNGGGNFVTTNRPNLRSLPGYTTTGSAATLMLVDGHRVVGMGIASTTPDADLVPPGAIERVEIVPDGGSAIYGSDAVAGVINFITRKRFDGVDVNARYGFADQYHTFDANATVGKDWDSGSAYISYNYAEHSTFYGRDRDFVQVHPTLNNGVAVRSIACPKANVLVSGVPLGIPGLNPPTPALYASPISAATKNTVNNCDLSDDASVYPEEKRHSVFANLTQQLNDSIEFNMRAFYMNREMYQSLGKYFDTVNLGPSFLAPFGFLSSPFFVPATSYPGETQAINFAFGPGDGRHQNLSLETWGVTPSIDVDLGGSWKLRALASYGESITLSHSSEYNSRALPGLVTSGKFNPYAPDTSDPAALATLRNWENYGRSAQRHFDARAIVDGDLFTLPGGAVKLAVGAEYIEEKLVTRKGQAVPGTQTTALPRFNLGRNVKSVFGEVVVPIFSSENATTAFDELTLSLSGRRDDYSDVGNTFNPKIGLTWKPTDWIKVRGAWGKSFVAPSLADDSRADPTALNWVGGATVSSFLAPPNVLAANGYPAFGAGQQIMFLLGAKPGLRPQTAKTWSVGADIEPPFVPNLRISGTYWNMNYRNLISLVPFINSGQFWSTFAPQAITLAPSQALINSTIAEAGSVVGSACAPMPTCVYAIQDVRKQNLSAFKQSGLDFAVNYLLDTGFGSVDFVTGGSYILTRKTSPAAGAPFRSELATDNSRLKMRTSLGTNIGNLRAQASWNFSQGFDVNPTGLAPQQTHVKSFHVFDLFFKYDVNGEGAFKDLAFTVNVNNVLNQDPPTYRLQQIVLSQTGFYNGSTVGRLIQLGVSKKF